MSKKEETTGSNEPTMKDIEKHLKWQDKNQKLVTNRALYFTGLIFYIGLLFSTIVGFPAIGGVESFCDPYVIAMIVIELLAISYCYCRIRYYNKRIKEQ